MAQWKSTDAANGSPIWTAAQLKLTPNSANRDALFGNTTADATVTGTTKGVWGVSAAEASAQLGKVAHTGWVLRTTGSGGRAGRIHDEVLIAGGISSDSENTVFFDVKLVIATQPSNNAVANGAPASFTVVAATAPVGGSITYQWQYANGTAVTANSIYTNSTTATMTVSNTAGLNGTSYKVLLQATGATNVTSSNVVLTLTS